MVFSLAALLVLASVPAAQAQGDPNPDAAEWTEAEYTLTVLSGFDRVALNGFVLLHEIDPPTSIERVCNVPCTADDIRDLYEDPRFSKEDVVNAIEDAVAARAERALAAIAGPSGESTVDSNVSRRSLEEPAEGDEFQPPISVSVTGNATIGLLEDQDLTDSQIEALFEMGARVTMPVQQSVPAGSNATIKLVLPSPLTFLDASTAQVGQTPDGAPVATWTITNWQSTDPFSLNDPVKIGRGDVVVPEAEALDTGIVLDLSEIDVHYTNLIGSGPPASLDLSIDVNASLKAIQPPRELEGPIQLPMLSADAIRIGIDAGLIDRSAVTGFEDQARTGIRQAFAEGFGQQVTVEGGFVNHSFERDNVGSPPGTGGPIYLDMHAASTLPLPPEQTGGVQAFTITTVSIGDIPLPEIPLPGDRPSTYTFLLPAGVDLQFDQVTGGEVERITTEDGRSGIQFTSTGSGDQQPAIQGAELAIQHPIIWNLFWPVILVLFLLFVVLPGGLIYYNVRKRRDKPGSDKIHRERKSTYGGGEAESRTRPEHTSDDQTQGSGSQGQG